MKSWRIQNSFYTPSDLYLFDIVMVKLVFYLDSKGNENITSSQTLGFIEVACYPF